MKMIFDITPPYLRRRSLRRWGFFDKRANHALDFLLRKGKLSNVTAKN